MLEAAFGPAATVSVADVEPFLGEAGACRRGTSPTPSTGRHRRRARRAPPHDAAPATPPAAGMATLHDHYGRMLRLDGVPACDEKAAAALLGMKGSTFPAKKALTQSKRLGSERLATVIGLLADADLDLRGAKAWPPELVLEVLVARLARLGRPVRRPRQRRPSRGYSARRPACRR